MTPGERRNHTLINGSRRKRIARGSGTTVEEVNRVLKQFVEMRKMLKADERRGGGGRKGRQRLMGMLREDARLTSNCELQTEPDTSGSGCE